VHGNAVNAKQLMVSQERERRGLRTESVVAQYLSTEWKGATNGRGRGKDMVNGPSVVVVQARSGVDTELYID